MEVSLPYTRHHAHQQIRRTDVFRKSVQARRMLVCKLRAPRLHHLLLRWIVRIREYKIRSLPVEVPGRSSTNVRPVEPDRSAQGRSGSCAAVAGIGPGALVTYHVPGAFERARWRGQLSQTWGQE